MPNRNSDDILRFDTFLFDEPEHLYTSERDAMATTQRVVALLKVAKHGSILRFLVSKKTSTQDLAEALETSYRAARKVIRDKKEHEYEVSQVLLKATILLGHVILGVLESLGFQSLVELEDDPGIVADWMKIFLTIDSILQGLKNSLSPVRLADLLLAPLFAANVSLACSIRQYDKAHHVLAGLVGTKVAYSASESIGVLPLSQLSELLLSQLVQLRTSLPSPQDDIVLGLKVPEGIEKMNEMLASHICDHEVSLHHLCLFNDRRLTDIACNSLENSHDDGHVPSDPFILRFCIAVRDSILYGTTCERLELRGCPLVAQDAPMESLRSPLPQGILLAGATLQYLDLSSTNLTALPELFGFYFPSLKHLELAENSLENIPDSIIAIKSLEVLRIPSNRIKALPEKFVLQHLTTFEASHNNIEMIPLTFHLCKQLEMVDLSGNPLKPSFWLLMAKLPRLRILLPRQNLCIEAVCPT